MFHELTKEAVEEMEKDGVALEIATFLSVDMAKEVHNKICGDFVGFIDKDIKEDKNVRVFIVTEE